MIKDGEIQPPDISRARVIRGGLVLALGLGAAQVTGFLRQAAIGYLLGTGVDADALSAAMAPVELWWSVLALAVIFGFVPKMLPGGGYAFADVMRPVSRLAVGSSAVFLIFASPLVRIFAPGLDVETAERGAALLRVVGLAPAAVGCSFVYSALLFSRRRFALPSYHHAMVNTATILGALALYGAIGAYGFAVGYASGAWLQLGIAHLYARKLIAEQTAESGSEGRRVELWTLLSGPAPILGQALAMEANTAVTRAYASTFGPGMTAAFEYGYKLFRVPLAMLVVPLSQSLLPEISEMQPKAGGRLRALRAMKRAAGLVIVAGALITVGMIVLRNPIVAVLFERGRFGETSTAQVALVLLSYMPAMIGRGLTDLLSRTLFGTSRYRTAVLASCLALALNALICSALGPNDPTWIGLGAVVGFAASAIWIVAFIWRIGDEER